MASPFEQPAGQALMQAVQLINRAAAQKQQLDLQQQQLQIRQRESEQAISQREQNLDLARKKLELDADIESRLSRRLDLQEKEAAGETASAKAIIGKLQAETRRLDAQALDLEQNDPDTAAQAKLLQQRLGVVLQEVGGQFSTLSPKELQNDIAQSDEAIARFQDRPLNDLIREGLAPGETLPTEVDRNKKVRALIEKIEAQNNYLDSLSPNDQRIAEMVIPRIPLPGRPNVQRSSTGQALPEIPRKQRGPLSPVDQGGGASSTIANLRQEVLNELKGIDKLKFSTDTNARERMARSLADKLQQGIRSGEMSKPMKNLLISEIEQSLGSSFLDEIQKVYPKQ